MLVYDNMPHDVHAQPQNITECVSVGVCGSTDSHPSRFIPPVVPNNPICTEFYPYNIYLLTINKQ